jgi:hypothetical protein
VNIKHLDTLVGPKGPAGILLYNRVINVLDSEMKCLRYDLVDIYITVDEHIRYAGPNFNQNLYHVNISHYVSSTDRTFTKKTYYLDNSKADKRMIMRWCMGCYNHKPPTHKPWDI